MLRLFYLLLIAAVSVALLGCASSMFWLAGDEDTAAKDKNAGTNARPPDDAAGADSSLESPRDALSAGATKQPPSESAVKSPATPAASAQAPVADELAALGGHGALVSRQSDPAAIDMQALGFNDPKEEASARAALQAAPPEHRAMLLRTMRAGLATRHQGETAGRPPKSDELYVDPNAVAVIEVKPAEDLPDVVNGDGRSNGSRRGGRASNVMASARTPEYGAKRGTVEAGVATDTPSAAPIHAAGVSEAPAGQWRDHLDRAIAALEEDFVHGGDYGGDHRERALIDARLRLLYLLAGRRDEALRSRASGSAAEQEFWTQELYGLATLLDSEKQPDARKRAALAAGHLRQAAERIGELGGLAVKNLHFCTEVKGFGTFVAFAEDEFRPGQEVLLYCEIDNFTSKLTEQGYHTALKAQYQVFDASGNRVAERDLGLKEEHCRNRRRDFFVPYFLWIPKQAPAGKYQLKLTLEDVNSGQTAEGTIGFGIREK